jgi:hypothetical protein
MHLRRSPRLVALAAQLASRTNPYRGTRTWTGRVPQLRSGKRLRPGVTVPHRLNRHQNHLSRNQQKHRRRSLPILRRVRTFERRAKKRQASLVSDPAGGPAHLPLQNACRRENGKAITATTRASLGDDILIRGIGVRLLARLSTNEMSPIGTSRQLVRCSDVPGVGSNPDFSPTVSIRRSWAQARGSCLIQFARRSGYQTSDLVHQPIQATAPDARNCRIDASS